MKISDREETVASQGEDFEKQGPGFPRDCLAAMPDLAGMNGQALVVTGVRRCGKSALLRQWVGKLECPYVYSNFDDPRFQDWAAADYQVLDRALEDRGAGLLVLDGAQAAPEWERYVRRKLDEGVRVALGGSHAGFLTGAALSRLGKPPLTRRVLPLSFGEYLRLKGGERGPASLDAYLREGGFPERVVSSRLVSPPGSREGGGGDFPENPPVSENPEPAGLPGAPALGAIEGAFLRDRPDRLDGDACLLSRVYDLLVSGVGRFVDPQRLGAAAGIRSAAAAPDYVAWFEAAYVIARLPRYAWSAQGRDLAPKKLYVVDPSLVRPDAGSPGSGCEEARLENFVFNSLRRRYEEVFYFTGGAGGGCDFVVSDGWTEPVRGEAEERIFHCVQVCGELSPENQDREIQGLLTAMKFFAQNQGTLVTRNTRDEIHRGGRRITVIPAWAFE